MADVMQKVVDIVSKKLNVEASKITPESHFVNDFNADSLVLIEVIMELEQEFGCEIPEADANKIQTVQDAIDYIQKHAA